LMAANDNNKLVHPRVPFLEPGSTRFLTYWILEAVAIILIPVLFSIRAITGYSDKTLSAEELHEHFNLADSF